MISMKITDKIKTDKLIRISLSVALLSVVISVVGLSVLPEKLYIQLFSEIPVPETDSVLFFAVSAIMVCLSSAMCVLTADVKKWLALETVLIILQLGAAAYNTIVLL